MTILIADSGSTKTDWLYTDSKGNTTFLQTKGINPFFRSVDDIYQELKKDLFPKIQIVQQVYFYGAGIIDTQTGDIIKSALKPLFPHAVVETNSDVLAAARGLFKTGAGIACILGTGSGACLYDGEKIQLGIPPLGFILGDECSGSALGRKLLGDYFKGVMPAYIKELFLKEYTITQAEVLEKVYKTERPNKYLAGFAPFLSQHIEKEYCENLVNKSVKEFIERNVLQIPEAKSYPLGFSGSIAWNFKPIIEKVSATYGFSTPLIIQRPIESLKEYYSILK